VYETCNNKRDPPVMIVREMPEEARGNVQWVPEDGIDNLGGITVENDIPHRWQIAEPCGCQEIEKTEV
jgi:hypothetical protein